MSDGCRGEHFRLCYKRSYEKLRYSDYFELNIHFSVLMKVDFPFYIILSLSFISVA